MIKNYGVLPLITCYAGQLNQVFMNLLANIIDTLRDVNCTQNCLIFQPQITIHTEIIGGDGVRISIADNGVGMTESVRSIIFHSFFTTKPMGKGTGMGLSISQQIVTEKHGGQLKCVSSHCQGTKFIIEIPIA